MSAELVFQAVEAIVLVIAVGFAMLQVRQYHRNKHREAALEMLHSFQTPSFASGTRKLRGYVTGERQEAGRETISEWFQWLNERLVDAESKEPPIPAHIAHKDWRSKNPWWK